MDLLESAIEATKEKTKTSEFTEVLQEISSNGNKEVQKEEYFEVNYFLNLLDEEQKNKIPLSFRIFFEKKKLQTSDFKIDLDTPIQDQNLKDETLAIIAFLYLKYLCEETREKIKLSRIYEENEEKANNETIEKETETINETKKVENIIESVNKTLNENANANQQEQQLALIPHKKKSIFTKFIERIKAIFHIGERQLEEN